MQHTFTAQLLCLGNPLVQYLTLGMSGAVTIEVESLSSLTSEAEEIGEHRARHMVDIVISTYTTYCNQMTELQ